MSFVTHKLKSGQKNKKKPPPRPPPPNFSKYKRNQPKINIPPIFGPTIIRPSSGKNKAVSGRIQNSESPSPPMPSIPPQAPPKDAEKIDIPYGIALYDYQGTDPRDLSFQTNDVIILLRRINREWLYGKVLDTEGMFPANFIDIQVPLDEDDKTVMALYEFNSQMEGDLKLKPGQVIRVLKKLNDDWYYGESNGQLGQFPVNFVDRIPNV
ncbi:hypothetical protein NQ317_009965 [Molorchus minor]|uniref:SH3 domain-containing protein n=1 Tax=Molorchus minor TaxID=1323400 RepID=A0ABQ9K6K6_9CUCU|nr:hypothetical protein NQ317_009965 [Molorchus minor]